MFVCAHGNVDEFCRDRDMLIVDRYSGDIKDYNGLCRVLVTDADIGFAEYYLLKGELLAKRVELVSTRHRDVAELSSYLVYVGQRENEKKRRGKPMFGFDANGGLRETGRAVVERIFELRDKGYTYRQICEDEGVHHPDGRKISISTIQVIIKNRKRYEEELYGGKED